MDREGANFENVLADIRKRLRANPVPVQIPIGAGPPHVAEAFRGVVDLLSMKMLHFTEKSDGAEILEEEIPAEFLDAAKQARNTLLEQLYDYSNKLMELALEEAEIPVDLLHSRDSRSNASSANYSCLLWVGSGSHWGTTGARRRRDLSA